MCEACLSEVFGLPDGADGPVPVRVARLGEEESASVTHLPRRERLDAVWELTRSAGRATTAVLSDAKERG